MLQQTFENLKFETVVNVVQDSIIVINSSGMILHINKAAELMFGYTLDEVANIKNVSTLMPEPYTSEHDKYLERYRHGSEARMIGKPRQLKALKKDGTIFDMELNVSKIPKGCFIGIIRDVSNRVEQEQTITTLRAANSVKTEYLSRVSHEFRTPLNSIIGFSQLLEMNVENFTDEDFSYIHYIYEAGKHLLALVDDILNISKLEAQKVEFSLEWINLHEFLIELVETMKPSTVENSITIIISKRIKQLEVFVKIDRNRIKQVIFNILSNAVKYNKKNGYVLIDAQQSPKFTERFFCVSFIDTGVGMEKDQLKRLFIPFDRLGADSTTIPGTGLGLVLTKALIEGMKGKISVDSEGRDKGTTITIWFPEYEIRDDPTSAQNSGADQTKLENTTVPMIKVLYIEDNIANFILIEAIMKKFKNIKLLSAVQGNIGIQLAKQEHPNIILLDLHLPDMHGSTVLKELLQFIDPQTKIAVLSADANKEQRKYLLENGAHEFLTKPINVAQFSSMIKNFILPSQVY